MGINADRILTVQLQQISYKIYIYRSIQEFAKCTFMKLGYFGKAILFSNYIGMADMIAERSKFAT